MKKVFIAVLLAALSAGLFLSAADTNFPIYFPNSKLMVKSEYSYTMAMSVSESVLERSKDHELILI